MNKQQRLFAELYVGNGFNITQAALKAGYSKSSAPSQGSRLLKNAKVSAYIQHLQDKATTEAIMTRQEVLENLSKIARGNMKKLAVWGDTNVKLKKSEELEEDDSYTVQEVAESLSKTGYSLKIKQHDKVKALELLSKHYGLLDGKSGTGDDPEDSETIDEEISSTLEGFINQEEKTTNISEVCN